MDFDNPMIRLTGSDNPQSPRFELRAGDLRCIYESGMIRYISSGNSEVIRCIYSAVRDRNWRTIIPVISQEIITVNQSSFSISFKANYNDPLIDFEADYDIIGAEDNTIVLQMNGHALRTFFKNRIGFCILHPLNVIKGKACSFTGPDGIKRFTKFPDFVCPSSPMSDILRLEWRSDDTKCCLDFTGDVWEMEDQRNWTDSSFKTFCTPLSIPYPAEVKKGSAILQSVTFKLSGRPGNSFIRSEDVIIKEENFLLRTPAIGTVMKAGYLFTANESVLIRNGSFNHLRSDLKFSDPDWKSNLEKACSNIIKCGSGMELVLHFTERTDEDIKSFEKMARDINPSPSMIWVIGENSRISDDQLLSKVLPPVRRIFPEVQVGAGTDSNFAEFNRNRFRTSDIEFVTFAISPQVHAFDNGTLVENIEAQCDVVESASNIYPGKRVHISPVTLKQRFNVAATGEENPLPDDQLPYPVDARQMSLFAAGWTFGSIVSLARGGADSATFFEAVGWQGVIQGSHDPENPYLFAGRKGDIFPVYHVLRLFCRMKDRKIIPFSASDPLKCTAATLVSEKYNLLVVVNHTGETIRINTMELKGEEYAVWNSSNIIKSFADAYFLDTLEYRNFDRDFVQIEPYSFLFIKKAFRT